VSRLEVRRACELEARAQDQRWLVEGLWAAEAVGIVGGEPKCCKSFLALDVAVSVASGAPCLRRFSPRKTGPVLLFAAEDALHVVRRRLEGIALAAGVAFPDLDVHVVTTPVVRLDLDDHRKKLTETVEALRPKLLVLDPFVRLHRIDENAAAEVAPLLAYLRELERCYKTAVLLVHHARKGAAHARAGQALRGSSELHAWGDSNLYLRRKGEGLLLTIEHRAAPSSSGLALELRQQGQALALHVIDAPRPTDPPDPPGPSPSIAEGVVLALAKTKAPLTLRQLRDACRVRMARLCTELAALTAAGRVLKSDTGYRLAVGAVP
jgi:hypothetical protein